MSEGESRRKRGGIEGEGRVFRLEVQFGRLLRLTGVRKERRKPLGRSESPLLLERRQGDRGREWDGLLGPRGLLLLELVSVRRVRIEFVRRL